MVYGFLGFTANKYARLSILLFKFIHSLSYHLFVFFLLFELYVRLFNLNDFSAVDFKRFVKRLTATSISFLFVPATRLYLMSFITSTDSIRGFLQRDEGRDGFDKLIMRLHN